MNGTNGMKITRKLRDIQFKAPIIFLTAHADYAVESYEVYVAGYLLKPYDTNKLTLLLDEVLQRSVQKRIAVKVKKPAIITYFVSRFPGTSVCSTNVQ